MKLLKKSVVPSLRVEPQLRQDAEELLEAGESLSQFIETALRSQIAFRKANAEFLARGLASRDKARHTGRYVQAEDVLKKLNARL